MCLISPDNNTHGATVHQETSPYTRTGYSGATHHSSGPLGRRVLLLNYLNSSWLPWSFRSSDNLLCTRTCFRLWRRAPRPWTAVCCRPCTWSSWGGTPCSAPCALGRWERSLEGIPRISSQSVCVRVCVYVGGGDNNDSYNNNNSNYSNNNNNNNSTFINI